MEKDFDTWNKKKKNVNRAREQKAYKSREIWWAILGLNIGHEQDGIGSEFSRPVLVIRDFNQYTCLVVPLTTSPKRNGYYLSIGKIEGREAAVNISQLRLIDTARLTDKICSLSHSRFAYIREKVRSII